MQERILHIKNMVCHRCVLAVADILRQEGLEAQHIELGTATLPALPTAEQRERLRKRLKEYGFELLDDRRQCLIEQIRTAVIEYVRYDDSARKTNLSDYLTRKCRHDYSALSRLFSEANGTSIERYYILQRVERVKELLIYDELSVSEIADRMGYSSAAHLSAQFKNVTGMSPTRFKQLKDRRIRPIDSI